MCFHFFYCYYVFRLFGQTSKRKRKSLTETELWYLFSIEISVQSPIDILVVCGKRDRFSEMPARAYESLNIPDSYFMHTITKFTLEFWQIQREPLPSNNITKLYCFHSSHWNYPPHFISLNETQLNIELRKFENFTNLRKKIKVLV